MVMRLEMPGENGGTLQHSCRRQLLEWKPGSEAEAGPSGRRYLREPHCPSKRILMMHTMIRNGDLWGSFQR